jgi:acyl carrier protein
VSLEAEVIKVVSRVTKVPVGSLSAQAGLGNIPQWDSLNHTILVLELENFFDIGFDFDELDKIVTVEAIVRSIEAKRVNI